MSYWRKRDSQQMDRILLRTVQLWELWRQCSTGLQPDPEEDLQPILREEVEIAVASLKKGKSVGVDNIPAELVQAGGETMIDVLTEIYNRIWRQENGLPHGLSRWLLHSLKRATCSSARTSELSASSVIRAKPCWQSSWIGLNPKLKK